LKKNPLWLVPSGGQIGCFWGGGFVGGTAPQRDLFVFVILGGPWGPGSFLWVSRSGGGVVGAGGKPPLHPLRETETFFFRSGFLRFPKTVKFQGRVDNVRESYLLGKKTFPTCPPPPFPCPFLWFFFFSGGFIFSKPLGGGGFPFFLIFKKGGVGGGCGVGSSDGGS